MIDWNKVFAEAHLNSWPTASLCVQNANPSSSQGGRNIFKEDERSIMEAAARHGYKISGSRNAKVISFIR